MAPQRIPPRRLAWLREELDGWRADGLIDDAAAEAIPARYTAATRLRIVTLLLGLGAALLGAGLIWLVASNLEVEGIGPLARFAGVAAVWLALVAAAEACAASERLDPLSGPARLLATLAYGGAIFQAAQSLQVPAFDTGLLGAWAAGGLLYAYATASRAPLVAAVAIGAGWFVAVLAEASASGAAFALGLALAVPVCAAAAALHDAGELHAPFAGPWRTVGALLGVAALFVVAFPDAASGDVELTATAVVAAVLAVGMAIAAALRGAADRRLEVLAAVGLVLAVVALLAVAPEDVDFGEDSGDGLGYALLAMLAFVAWAVGIAVVGAARDAPRLVDVAFGALLLFVAVQSFGIIGSLISGAALLLTVGVLLLALGFALDRGRRRLLDEAAGR